jgi:CheY-like chemotaxis protein
MARILVIDDDPDWLRYLHKLLGSAGHETMLLNRGTGAVDAIQQYDPHLVITDILMPGVSGGIVHSTIRNAVGHELPVLVCSSTRLTIKTDDSRVAHVTKQDAPEHLLPTIELMLESKTSDPGTSTASPSSIQDNQA